MCIRHSGIILISYTTFVPNFVSFVASIAQRAHGEKLHIQSPSLIDALGTKVLALGIVNLRRAQLVLGWVTIYSWVNQPIM